MRAQVLLGTTLVLALAATGCSGADDEKSGSGDSASPSASASAPSSPTASAAAISGTGGSILVAPADSPAGGRCTPAPRQGVVCSADRRTTYRFQPEALRRVGVRSATGEDDPSNGWQARLTTTTDGRRVLARVTGAAARTRQVVVVLTPGRRLVAAPQVDAAITGGEVQISGSLSQARVRQIVRQVTSTDG